MKKIVRISLLVMMLLNLASIMPNIAEIDVYATDETSESVVESKTKHAEKTVEDYQNEVKKEKEILQKQRKKQEKIGMILVVIGMILLVMVTIIVFMVIKTPKIRYSVTTILVLLIVALGLGFAVIVKVPEISTSPSSEEIKEKEVTEDDQKEEARLAEEKAKAEEARLAEEKAKAEEEARLAEEKAKAEEEARLAEEKGKAEEAARLAEEKAKAEEAARIAALPLGSVGNKNYMIGTIKVFTFSEYMEYLRNRNRAEKAENCEELCSDSDKNKIYQFIIFEEEVSMKGNDQGTIRMIDNITEIAIPKELKQYKNKKVYLEVEQEKMGICGGIYSRAMMEGKVIEVLD